MCACSNFPVDSDMLWTQATHSHGPSYTVTLNTYKDTLLAQSYTVTLTTSQGQRFNWVGLHQNANWYSQWLTTAHPSPGTRRTENKTMIPISSASTFAGLQEWISKSIDSIQPLGVSYLWQKRCCSWTSKVSCKICGSMRVSVHFILDRPALNM